MPPRVEIMAGEVVPRSDVAVGRFAEPAVLPRVDMAAIDTVVTVPEVGTGGALRGMFGFLETSLPKLALFASLPLLSCAADVQVQTGDGSFGSLLSSALFFVGAVVLGVSGEGSAPFLPEKRKKELVQKVQQNGDAEALKTLVATHDLLVAYATKEATGGQLTQDVLQDGFVGLLEVIRTMNLDLGYKFASYAIPAVRNHVGEAMFARKFISFPEWLIGVFSFIGEYYLQHGALPAAREIRAAANGQISIKTAEDLLIAMQAEEGIVPNNPLVDPAEEEDIEGMLEPVLTEGGEAVAPSAEDLYLQAEMVRLVSDTVQRLNERKSRIVTKYFGLGGGRPMTLAAIGKDEGVSGDRIKQIRNQAQRILGRMISLLEYFEPHEWR